MPNDEWMTPPKYIAKARAVMGSIDLDPASSKLANKIVGARLWYGKDVDGLTIPWGGHVWLNPPYSYPLVEQFTRRMQVAYNNGHVSQAICLVNNATDTMWFQALARSYPFCLTKGRISFLGSNGKSAGQNRQGQAFFFLGCNIIKVKENFADVGTICHAEWRNRC